MHVWESSHKTLRVYGIPALPSTGAPHSKIHLSALSLISWNALRTKRARLRAVTAFLMFLSSSGRSHGTVVYTSFLRWPQRKKSHGVRSGERGGHSWACPRLMIRLGKFHNHIFYTSCAMYSSLKVIQILVLGEKSYFYTLCTSFISYSN